MPSTFEIVQVKKPEPERPRITANDVAPNQLFRTPGSDSVFLRCIDGAVEFHAFGKPLAYSKAELGLPHFTNVRVLDADYQFQVTERV